MSAIGKLKAEMYQFPIEYGAPAPPTFHVSEGGVPIGLARVIIELIERVEALEKKL